MYYIRDGVGAVIHRTVMRKVPLYGPLLPGLSQSPIARNPRDGGGETNMAKAGSLSFFSSGHPNLERGA